MAASMPATESCSSICSTSWRATWWVGVLISGRTTFLLDRLPRHLVGMGCYLADVLGICSNSCRATWWVGGVN